MHVENFDKFVQFIFFAIKFQKILDFNGKIK